MLRNSKPIINKLTDELISELNNMGFGKYYDSCYRKIDNINCKAFYKTYHFCGGSVDLRINIENPHIFCGTEVNPCVEIWTPYDSWWCKGWSISEFTKDMEDFQNELKKDLQKLRKLGIIS
jgi:hypothetical protein